MRSSGKRNREAAAEAVIRRILSDERLDYGEISEKYSHITIAETIVIEEVE